MKIYGVPGQEPGVILTTRNAMRYPRWRDSLILGTERGTATLLGEKKEGFDKNTGYCTSIL